MPRQARVYSNTDIYHVMIRGNDKRKIFLDDEDRSRFIYTLFDKAPEEKTDIYAYCLMSNHIHLLLHVDKNNIARLIKRINVSFVYYFNKKYKCVGHLFQDRFKSEVVEDEDYLLAAVRYIHNNPVKAGIVRSQKEYRWSSYYDYVKSNKRNNLQTEKILLMFSENKLESVKQFIEFSSLDCDINFIDFVEKSNADIRIEKENLAKETIENILNNKKLCINDLSERNNYKIRNEIINKLAKEFELSTRQIATITKISRGTILNICKEMNN